MKITLIRHNPTEYISRYKIEAENILIDFLSNKDVPEDLIDRYLSTIEKIATDHRIDKMYVDNQLAWTIDEGYTEYWEKQRLWLNLKL